MRGTPTASSVESHGRRPLPWGKRQQQGPSRSVLAPFFSLSLPRCLLLSRPFHRLHSCSKPPSASRAPLPKPQAFRLPLYIPAAAASRPISSHRPASLGLSTGRDAGHGGRAARLAKARAPVYAAADTGVCARGKPPARGGVSRVGLRAVAVALAALPAATQRRHCGTAPSLCRRRRCLLPWPRLDMLSPNSRWAPLRSCSPRLLFSLPCDPRGERPLVRALSRPLRPLHPPQLRLASLQTPFRPLLTTGTQSRLRPLAGHTLASTPFSRGVLRRSWKRPWTTGRRRRPRRSWPTTLEGRCPAWGEAGALETAPRRLRATGSLFCCSFFLASLTPDTPTALAPLNRKHKLRFLRDVASKVVFHWHYGPDDMLFQTQVRQRAPWSHPVDGWRCCGPPPHGVAVPPQRCSGTRCPLCDAECNWTYGILKHIQLCHARLALSTEVRCCPGKEARGAGRVVGRLFSRPPLTCSFCLHHRQRLDSVLVVHVKLSKQYRASRQALEKRLAATRRELKASEVGRSAFCIMALLPCCWPAVSDLPRTGRDLFFSFPSWSWPLRLRQQTLPRPWPPLLRAARRPPFTAARPRRRARLARRRPRRARARARRARALAGCGGESLSSAAPTVAS